MASGKTQKIHQEIQAKQKELQPWTTKIDAKKTQLDVAQSERDTLVQRSEALQKAVDEGVEALATLQAEQKDKVRSCPLSPVHRLNSYPLSSYANKPNARPRRRSSRDRLPKQPSAIRPPLRKLMNCASRPETAEVYSKKLGLTRRRIDLETRSWMLSMDSRLQVD